MLGIRGACTALTTRFAATAIPACVLIAMLPQTPLSVAVDSAGSTLYMLPYPVKVLMYSFGVMERVARCHMSVRCGDAGDYVPTLRLRKDVDGYTAVNYANRSLVAANAVVVADLYDPVRHAWIRQRLQPTDWQQRRHATGWRLEVNGATAARLHFYSRTTVARIVRVEK